MDTHSISPPSSVNSSRDCPSEDINSKYHRLATQYAQLRAQVVVLKKGLLDEREKHSFIKNTDVGKAQKIRTLEQEVDSLNFRNKQLSKRVDNLQTDLETLARKKGGSKGGHTADNAKDVASIHVEELECKIRENEVLHSKLQTIDERYLSRVRSLEEENMSLKNSKLDVDNILKVSKEDWELTLSKEQRKSSTLQVQVDKLQKKMDTLQRSKQGPGDPAPPRPGTRLPLRNKKVECLNLTAKDKKRSILVEQTLSVISGYLTDLSTSLSSYCTYLEQRVQIHAAEVGEPLTPTNTTLCTMLLGSSGHIRPLTVSFANFLIAVRNSDYNMKTCPQLKEFTDQHNKVYQFLIEVLSLSKQSLREESMLMSCSIQMENTNSQLAESIQPLTISLQNLSFSLSNISLIVDSSTAVLYIPPLIENLKELCTRLRKYLSLTHPRLILCHKLPTVTQRLKTTDECCVASLQSYTNTLTKIYRHLEDSSVLLTKPSRFCTEEDSVYSGLLTEHYQSYLQCVNTQEISDNLSSPEPLLSPPLQSPPVTPDNTVLELNRAKDKISKLQQSKEHWMLEAQLLNIKLEKLQKQLKETTENRLTRDNSNVPVDNLLDLGDSADSSVKSLSPWDDTGLREEAIRQHYTNRLHVLTDTVQKNDGLCVVYKQENLCLRKRLLVADRHHNQDAIDMCNTDLQKRQLQEELNLTKDKYESQIALMSEHLCAMNDKLVALNDENQQLKLESKRR